MSLATYYRPRTFDEVVGQDITIKILKNQIATQTTKSSYLFIGSSGCGKTTVARIFANELNNWVGSPIEIDAASNNGVDNIRTIIEDSAFKSITSEYKIYILDECHMLSIGAWNALLKILEEPPLKTKFILCTTDPQKIPQTIFSRAQRFDFGKIAPDSIFTHLAYILDNEGLSYEKDALNEIVKASDGGMRTAISLLEKCIDYDKSITYDNVLSVLNIVSFDTLLGLGYAIIDNDRLKVVEIVDSLIKSGADIKNVVEQLLSTLIHEEKQYIINGVNEHKFVGLITEILYILIDMKDSRDHHSILMGHLLSYMG